MNELINGLYNKIDNQEKIIRDLQEELQKADSITQSCIFEGKEESIINFRECLKALETYKQRIDKAIEYLETQIQEGRSESNLWLMGCYDEDKKLLEILRGEDKE